MEGTHTTSAATEKKYQPNTLETLSAIAVDNCFRIPVQGAHDYLKEIGATSAFTLKVGVILIRNLIYDDDKCEKFLEYLQTSLGLSRSESDYVLCHALVCVHSAK
jgi:hypothetical protein